MNNYVGLQGLGLNVPHHIRLARTWSEPQKLKCCLIVCLGAENNVRGAMAMLPYWSKVYCRVGKNIPGIPELPVALVVKEDPFANAGDI